MKRLYKIAAILSALALCQLAALAQDIPVYGNLVPSDSGAIDLGSTSSHWDTIFVNTIIPAVSDSVGDFSPWDTTAGNIIEKDTTQKVGIGTTSPQTAIDVRGDAYFHNADESIELIFDTTTGYFLVKPGDYLNIDLDSMQLYVGRNQTFIRYTTADSTERKITVSKNFAKIEYQQGDTNYFVGTYHDGVAAPFVEMTVTDTSGDISSHKVFANQITSVTSDSIIMNAGDTRINNLSAGGIVTADTGTGTLGVTSISNISPWTVLDSDSIQWIGLNGTMSIFYTALPSMTILDVSTSNSFSSTNNGWEFANSIVPQDSAGGAHLGEGSLRWSDSYINSMTTYSIIDEGSTVNTTAADTATINAISGRFRKDDSGAAFTLTNAYITANSIIVVTPANAAIDATATTWTVSAASGSATITFNAAPAANFDMNFIVIN